MYVLAYMKWGKGMFMKRRGYGFLCGMEGVCLIGGVEEEASLME